jgi:hypothetical protein
VTDLRRLYNNFITDRWRQQYARQSAP